ncbi:MAG: hypothetical protein EXR09_00275, partial [Acetobacteraceae bacterium]|nr:hypothetical protein [Acetobacteraceae bacterium]
MTGPFPTDRSAAAVGELGKTFKLIILSNVGRTSFAGSNRRLGGIFDAIHTAEDIGSYKPDPRNFRFLFDRCATQGVTRDKILHVAQSLYHDHAPANAAGITSAGPTSAPVGPAGRRNLRPWPRAM